MLPWSDIPAFKQQLEEEGEEAVRMGIALSRYNSEKTRIAMEWLRSKEIARQEGLARQFLTSIDRLSSPVAKGITAGVLRALIVGSISWLALRAYDYSHARMQGAEERLRNALLTVTERRVPSMTIVSLTPTEQLNLARELSSKFDPSLNRFGESTVSTWIPASKRDADLLLRRAKDMSSAKQLWTAFWTVAPFITAGLIFWLWKRLSSL